MDSKEGVTLFKNIYTEHLLINALEDERFLREERVGLPEDSRLFKLFQHPKIKKEIRSLLGTDAYHLTTLSSNTLFPNIDKRGYHVDWPYHKYTDEHGLNYIYQHECHGVQVIIPLDDFTVENGATMYVPYSHLARRFPSTEILQSGKFTNADDSTQIFACKKKFVQATVGDAFIYPGTLWHSQGVNTTDKPRRALLANFSPTFVPKKDY